MSMIEFTLLVTHCGFDMSMIQLHAGGLTGSLSIFNKTENDVDVHHLLSGSFQNQLEKTFSKMLQSKGSVCSKLQLGGKPSSCSCKKSKNKNPKKWKHCLQHAKRRRATTNTLAGAEH